jgi:hypothetical protein
MAMARIRKAQKIMNTTEPDVEHFPEQMYTGTLH